MAKFTVKTKIGSFTKTVLPRRLRMSKILVVIPPYVLGEDNKAVLPNKAMLPVGPLVVAGQLRDRGHEVQVLDLVFQEEWWQTLPASAPDILLLSCHTARNVPCCVTVLSELTRKWGFRPYTVLGGNVCLELGIADFRKLGLVVDAIVRGFGHTANVLEAIEQRQTGDIQPIAVTGNIPLPALDLLPPTVHQQYRRHSDDQHPMYRGIGCHWYLRCGKKHCKADMDSPWLIRSLDLVIEEIHLAKQYGYQKIWFVDNLLFADKQTTKDWLLLDQLIANLGMTWSGMTRAELICNLPQGFLERLTALTDVAMGVEAISRHLLENYERATKRHQMLKAFRAVREAGKSATAFVMLDLEDSTDQDFLSLFEFLEDLDQQVVTKGKTFSVSFSYLNPPASEVARGAVAPQDMGFNRYPLGYSRVSRERVAQHAMLLFGRWWKHPGWTPNFRNLYWETETEFGVNFLEGRLGQEKDARDPAGDLWETWWTEPAE